MYKNEFPPEYWPTDEEVRELEINGLSDSSWHNESAPSWSNYEKNLQLFIQPENPEDREYAEVGGRFVILRIDELNDPKDRYIVVADELSEALKEVGGRRKNTIRTSVAITSKVTNRSTKPRGFEVD